LGAREAYADLFTRLISRTYVFTGDGCLMEGISEKRSRWPATASLAT
jgi:transketolase